MSLIKIIDYFDEFDELVDKTLEYIDEIDRLYRRHLAQIPIQYNPDRIDIWDTINLWDAEGRPLNGAKETDFCEIRPNFKGTVIEKLILSIPTPVCRSRILRMNAHTFRQVKLGVAPEIYIPLISHIDSGFLFPNYDRIDTLETTGPTGIKGPVYYVNTQEEHTLINWGNHEIPFIVMNMLDKNYIPVPI
jgi:hypothetical protein